MFSNFKGSNAAIIGLLILGSVGYCFAYLLPQRRGIEETRSQIAQKKDAILKATSLPTALQATRDQYAMLTEYNQTWRDNSESIENTPRLLGAIHRLAESSGLQTTRFEPGSVTAMQRVGRSQLDIGIAGPYENIFQFLGKLESMSGVVWVKQIRITGEKEEGRDGVSGGNVACELNLEIFTGKNDSSDYVKDV